MGITITAMTDALTTVVKNLDFESLTKTTSKIFTTAKTGNSTVLGKDMGAIVGGVESLTPALTTLAEQTQTTMEPVVARVTSEMPGVRDHLINEISSSGATRIAELEVDSDVVSGLFADAQPLMTSTSTMLHDIISDGSPLSLGSALTSVTGLTLETFEPAMKELADSDFQNSVLSAAEALQKDEGVKSLTQQTKKLAQKVNSSSGPFLSGNLLSDFVENTSYTVTNSVRGIIPATEESKLLSITNNLLNGRQQKAIDIGVGNVPVPSELLTKAASLGIPLPTESQSSVNSFIVQMENLAPENLVSIDEYKKVVSNTVVALGSTKANVATAIKKRDGKLDEEKVVTSAETGQDKSFKTLSSIREIVKYLHSCERDLTTMVFHWSGHYSDAYNVGAKEIDNEYISLNKSEAPYHIVIKKNGDIQTGVSIHKESEHTYHAFRPRSIGVAFIGGYNESKPSDGSEGELTVLSITQSQLRSLKILIRAWYFAFPGGDVFGHRDLTDNGDQSPGLNIVASIWNYYRKKNGCEPRIDGRFLTTREMIQRAQQDNSYNRP